MRKLILLTLFVCPFIAGAQQGMYLISQTRDFIKNECGSLAINKNNDSTLAFYETKYTLGTYNFKNGICYRYSQTITDATTAEINLKQLKDKGVVYKEVHLKNGSSVWDSFFQGLTIRYIPSAQSKNSWQFTFTR